jgi:hypothetical protein
MFQYILEPSNPYALLIYLHANHPCISSATTEQGRTSSLHLASMASIHAAYINIPKHTISLILQLKLFLPIVIQARLLLFL